MSTILIPPPPCAGMDAESADECRMLDMANEELVQRGYLKGGKLWGEPFGSFYLLNIGATTVRELKRSGAAFTGFEAAQFPFKVYKPPAKPESAKPDRVYFARREGHLVPIAIGENKAPGRMPNDKAVLKACEQALFSGAALGVAIAVTTNEARYFYVNVPQSLAKGELVFFDELRDFNPAVLENLLAGDAGIARDPKPLAESVWQIIWHATKEEPKECLLTFVEIFVLKFLSDNLPKTSLPDSYSFYALSQEPAAFHRAHGMTAIEYYVTTIRPHIKKLFPDNVIVHDKALPALFGLQTLVSKTSIINGFAFLKSSEEQTVASYNRTFLEILTAFRNFGALTAIDPEFKLRLYETFLKQSARQQRLGQFFTPRNVVRQMIRMAQLGKLPKGAVVLDPAAGVGGFVLEPLLIPGALQDNIKFKNGEPERRVKVIGVDVDANTHILAKANMLIHLAEAVRDPSTTISGLNELMAETFVLMNTIKTLGTLENPVRGAADVILTNPPYVTQGSKIYKEEIASVGGPRNGLDLRDYYGRWGLGLEALFLRYISGALKPGGRAFIIVPLGMLNRTDPGPKTKLLEECNLVASIALPRNTFFNTAQLTYILVLERRKTAVDERPPVFCALIRSIGETLDWRRVPTPTDNDLETVASLFIDDSANGKKQRESCPLVKVIEAGDFGPDDRWDVARFWTEDELVALGQRESAIERVSFIDEAQSELSEISDDLAEARKHLLALKESATTITVPLSDESSFTVRAGERIRDEDIRQNPGDG